MAKKPTLSYHGELTRRMNDESLPYADRFAAIDELEQDQLANQYLQSDADQRLVRTMREFDRMALRLETHWKRNGFTG
jgi:hypothetical protein